MVWLSSVLMEVVDLDFSKALFEVLDPVLIWSGSRINRKFLDREGFYCMLWAMYNVDAVLGQLSSYCSFIPHKKNFLECIVLLFFLKSTNSCLEI